MNFLSIMPEAILFFGALMVLMTDVFLGKKFNDSSRVAFLGALIFSISSLITVVLEYNAFFITFEGMFYSNKFSCFAKIFALSLLILLLLISAEFVKEEKRISSEFVALMMIATAGSMFLISSNDLLPFYMALELQSLPLYILAAIKRESEKSSESGMKYFILGAISSAILLLGISMVYGFSGTTNFSALFYMVQHNAGHLSVGILFGFTLVLIAMLFKVSAVPFHMWTPDVYEGSATIVTAFFATAVKFISMIVLVRIYMTLAVIWPDVNQILTLVAILSLVVGSLGAIRQNNLKRVFAYSSIGHIGFILAGLAAISFDAIKAAILYITIYGTLSLGAFTFLIWLANKNKNPNSDAKNDEIYQLSAISGLGKTNPIIAACLAILMFSFAGVPPMAGFFSKFYILMAIVKKEFYFLAVIAVLTSVISAFYYLRIIKIMYFDNAPDNNITEKNSSNSSSVLVLMALISLLFIAYMKPFLSLIADIFQ